jgi:hypothetical protein
MVVAFSIGFMVGGWWATRELNKMAKKARYKFLNELKCVKND